MPSSSALALLLTACALATAVRAVAPLPESFSPESLIETTTIYPITAPQRHAVCVHDRILSWRTPNVTRYAHQNYGVDEERGRRLQDVSFAPIRINAVMWNLQQDAAVSTALATFISGTLVPAAVNRWQSLLNVRPVVGSLMSGGITQLALGNDPVISIPAGASWAHSDFVIYVTAVQTSTCGSGGSGVLAYAGSLARDNLDRPIIGRMNLCPGSLSTAASQLAFQVAVVMHEMGHALGYSSDSWPLWRNADGTPRTPRNPNNPHDVAAAYKVTMNCGGYSYQQALPAQTTISYFNERGASCVWGQQNAGPCVAKFVTPATLAAARAFFNCPTLNGAELESQDTTSCVVLASHQEQRLHNQDLMAPYAAHAMKVSPVVLATFVDSGWYTVNWGAADAFQEGLHWGYHQGCDFATQKCLVNNNGQLVGQGSPPHFWPASHGTDGGNAVCALDRLAVGYASVVNYAGSLPTPYQYFPGSASQGGGPPSVFDYCPATQAYSNMMCGVAANAWSGSQYFGMTFGAGSLCLYSSLIRSGATPAAGLGAGCYAVSCSSDATTLTVTLPGTGGGTTTVTCGPGSGGATRTVTGYAGQLTCPNPSAVCNPGSKWSPSDGGATPSPSAAAPSPAGTPSKTPSVSGTAASTSSSTASASGSLSAGASASITPSSPSTPLPSRSMAPTPRATVSPGAAALPGATPTPSASFTNPIIGGAAAAAVQTAVVGLIVGAVLRLAG